MSIATVQLVNPDGSAADDPCKVELVDGRLNLDGCLLELFDARVLKVHKGITLGKNREGLSIRKFEPGAIVLLEVQKAEETGGQLCSVSLFCDRLLKFCLRRSAVLAAVRYTCLHTQLAYVGFVRSWPELHSTVDSSRTVATLRCAP